MGTITKKIFCFLFVFVCLAYGIEYSLRIKALGTDFAYLIPDYETDLYQNPQLLGEKLSGISFEPNLGEPLTMRFLFKRFGLFGKYWGSYYSKKYSNYTLTDCKYIYINDLWMLDLRGKIWKFLADEVWNWFNDGVYVINNDYWNTEYFDSTRTIEYILSVNGSNRLGRTLTIQHKVCAGVYNCYKNYKYYSDVTTYDRWLIISTGKIGLYYRNTNIENKFTSWYLEVGGPVSTPEIDALPYSILSSLSDGIEIEPIHRFIYKNFVSKIAWAKGIPLDGNSFVTIGLHNVFLFQQTDERRIQTNINLRGVRNTFSLPIACEYMFNKIAVRLGTKLFYAIKGNKEWHDDSTILYINEHKIDFGYSFGLGWQIDEHWAIDFYNNSDLSSVKNWAIYIKRF